jgi:hypothetical protein
VSDTAFPLSALLPTNPAPTLTVEEAVRMVREEVGIQPQGPSKTTHIALADEQWGWEQLRDYVVTQIEKVNGIFPRNRITEKAIFTSFAKRWGSRRPEDRPVRVRGGRRLLEERPDRREPVLRRVGPVLRRADRRAPQGGRGSAALLHLIHPSRTT